MKVEDCVVFVKMPPGNTDVKRHRLPLGQCGVILETGDLFKVSFGDKGTYWLPAYSLELMNDEPAQKVLLSESPLAAAVSRDVDNERALRHSPMHIARQLSMLALDIALGCPLDRPNQPGYYTYVSRDTVRAIRATLDEAGIDWKKQHKELRK